MTLRWSKVLGCERESSSVCSVSSVCSHLFKVCVLPVLWCPVSDSAQTCFTLTSSSALLYLLLSETFTFIFSLLSKESINWLFLNILMGVNGFISLTVIKCCGASCEVCTCLYHRCRKHYSFQSLSPWGSHLIIKTLYNTND